MADAQPSANEPDGSSSEPAAAAPKDGVLRTLSGAARSAAGAVGRAAASLGNWLGSIGWGKFILLSMLLLILAAAIDSMFGSRPGPHHRGERRVPVDVNVTVDSNGLHISAPPGQGQPAQAAPKVRIDDKGVRIKAHKDDGRDVSVVIDNRGVRVEDVPPPADATSPQASRPPAASGPSGATAPPVQVTVPPALISDPDKVAEAVEAAKDQIEEIVQAQIDRQVEGLPREEEANRHMTWPDFGGLVALLLFVLMILKIAQGSKRRAESRAKAADAVAAEEGLKRQLAEAQLKTMQAQVEPHFLFNTLASVDYLIETDPARASRMQKNLIQYLRSAVPQMRQASSTLGQEIALCRSYLEILKVRMDERLQFAITMPAGLSSAAFPPMMLPTLVENSIKHGLEPKPEGGTLTLGCDVVNGNLRVAVADTGLGFGAAGSGGSGVGLNNVRERLQALFGARARLAIEPNSPGGTIATIEVPYTVGVPEPAPQPSAQPA